MALLLVVALLAAEIQAAGIRVSLAYPGYTLPDNRADAVSQILPNEAQGRTVRLSAPLELRLGVLPQRLELEVSPAEIQTGRDCGMAEMCGLDPCLCGSPDEFGACACNGTQATVPDITLISSDSSVAGLLKVGESWWLIPWGSGLATVEVHASLPHYQSASFTVQVVLEAPLGFTLILVPALLCVVVGLVVLIRIIWHRTRKQSYGPEDGLEGEQDGE